MGYLEDLNEITRTMANAKSAVKARESKSITKGALDGTMQFACMIGSSNDELKSTVTARLLERVYASFAQTYLSVNNTMDISIDKTPLDFIKRIHQNIKFESTGVDVYFEHCVETDEDYDMKMENFHSGKTETIVSEDGTRAIIFSLHDEYNNGVIKSYQENSVSLIDDVDTRPFANVSNSIFSEAYGNNAKEYVIKKGIDTSMGLAGTIANQVAKNAIDNTMNKKLTPEQELEQYGLKKAIDSKYTKQNELFKSQLSTNMKVPELTAADVKKSNDMQPYQLQVRLMAINDKNEFVQYMDFIVGIKVNLHIIKSEEMILNIKKTLENSGKIFNFIRWTTGEKSLFKDLLLNVNDMKLDISNRSKGGSSAWVTLKRLKEKHRAQKAFFQKYKIVPNSTLVISSYEYDVLKEKFGYDLKLYPMARKLTEGLFLMNFLIIDDARRTIDILFDGASSFQTYALETLEREISMSSNKLGKELTRMIGG